MLEVVEGRRVLRQLTGLAAPAVLTYLAAAGRCVFVGSGLEAHRATGVVFTTVHL
jgi:hypothetical protein